MAKNSKDVETGRSSSDRAGGEPKVEGTFSIALDWREGYVFEVDFQKEGVPGLQTDESPPLGEDDGPSPAQLLAAGVGNCMAASLKMCLERSRVELEDLDTRVEGVLVRNEAGRLRVGSLEVVLEPTVDLDQRARIERCIDIFQDFCIVGASVRDGIELDVTVNPLAGSPAKEPA